MYIIFNPNLLFLNKVIIHFLCYVIFILALLITYWIYNKEIPNLFRFNICFIPIIILSSILNYNINLNKLFENKSNYISIFEIIYAIIVIKLIYKNKWKDSIIIGLASVFFDVIALPIITISVSYIMGRI